MHKTIQLAAILGLIVFTGCCTSTQQAKPFQPIPVAQDPTLIKIGESAKKIENGLEQLVTLENSNRHWGITMVVPKQGAMAEELTVSWTGALKPILEEIAKKIKYELEFTGQEPAVPLTVVVDEKTTPVYSILETIFWQVSPKAELLVNPTEKTLKVAYANSYCFPVGI